MKKPELDEKILDEIIVQGTLVNDSLIEAINSNINKSFALVGFFISFLAFSFQNELLKSQKLEQWIFIQCLLIVFLVLYLLEIYLMNSVIPSATKLNTNIDLAQNGMIEIKKERIRTLKQALDDNEQNNNKYNNRVINATLFFIFSLIFNTIFQNIFKKALLQFEWIA